MSETYSRTYIETGKRNRLRDRALRKYVEDFNPQEVARICPILKEIIVLQEDETK